jgi:hypothetical protein
VEQANFETTYTNGLKHIKNWSEEDLKMKFISSVLTLGKVMEDVNFVSFFDKKLSAEVQGYSLSVKADFVIAKGLMDFMQKPYFHFQEYKPNKNPTGDSMAQLLEAFLIAQVINDDAKPLYGCEVNGANWNLSRCRTIIIVFLRRLIAEIERICSLSLPSYGNLETSWKQYYSSDTIELFGKWYICIQLPF